MASRVLAVCSAAAAVLALTFSPAVQGSAVAGGPVPIAPWGTSMQGDQIDALWIDEQAQVVWVGWSQSLQSAGLRRYDGGRAEEQLGRHESSLRRVQAIIGDGEGGVWVGTQIGLFHMRKDADAWQRYQTQDGLSDNWIVSLALDRRGGLWIGTLRDLMHFDGQGFEPVLDTPRSVEAVLSLEDGSVYLAAGTEVIMLSPEGEQRRYGADAGMPGAGAHALASDGRRGAWAGTPSGLYRLAAGVAARTPLVASAGEPEPAVLSLVEDGGGGLWLGTDRGLLHYGSEGIDLWLRESEGQLAADRVNALARAQDGTLWIGTGRGLNRWNPERWAAFPAAGTGVRALAGDQRRLWGATAEGLILWDGEGWTRLTAEPAYGLWVDQGWVWFGTDDGLQWMRSDAETGDRIESVSIPAPRAIAAHDSGDLWVGTSQGLYRLRDRQVLREYHASNRLSSDFVYALLAETGMLWVGTSSGLNRLSLPEGEVLPPIRWPGGSQANTVRAVARGPDGSLWAGTEAGLQRLPPGGAADSPDDWIGIAKSQPLGADCTNDAGLTNDLVYAIWVDPNEQLWVGTNGGLSGLDDNHTPSDLQDDIWVGIGAGDGLGSSAARALWRDAQGALWIGTDEGPVRHIPQAHAPRLQLEDDNEVPGLRAQYAWDKDALKIGLKTASLGSDRFVHRYRLASADPAPSGWCSLQLAADSLTVEMQPEASYDITIQAFDLDLNASAPAQAEFSVAAVPFGQRDDVRVGLLLVASGSLAAFVVAVPGRRWWRAYKRPSYRETWEIEFSQARPDLPVFTAYARQRYRRDLRLLLEGRAGRLRRPEGQAIVASQELPNDLAALHARWLSAADRSDPASEQAFGRGLATALIPPGMARRLIASSTRHGYFVRIRLDFAAAPGLAAWPWEVAMPGEMAPLGLNRATALSRSMPRPPERPELSRLPRDRPLSVLLVVASPLDVGVPRIDAAAELERVERALAQVPAAVRMLAGVGAGGPKTDLHLKEALAHELEGGADVVHFSGHGGTHPRRRHEIVLYGEDRYGDLQGWGAQDLVGMIAASQQGARGPRLLLLSACRTAEVDGREALAGLVPELMMKTALLAVVGMQYPVGDEAARVFASAFYGSVARTEPLDYAVSLGRSAMKSEAGGRDWAAPVLYLRVGDGMIYEP